MELGDVAVSDFMDSPTQHVERSSLDLMLCRSCGLVQLAEAVSRESIYGKHYHYRSGLQESMVEALHDVVRGVLKGGFRTEPRDVWMDIGANDGTLLKFVPNDFTKIAYEPATNFWPELAGIAGVAGRYWPAKADLGVKARVITSIACFYSATNPDQFVDAIKRNLAYGGVWVNQMSYLPHTMATNNFGDICHEHLTYWTARAFQNLLARHDLKITGTQFNDVNGGSFRTYVTHGADRPWVQDEVTLLQLRRFGQRVRLGSSEIRSLLHTLKRDGKSVMGYGASTKGNTYLQVWGITPDLLEFIADRNPDKHGKFTPTGQQIVSEDVMRCANPDYLLMLPWHFRDSFIKREQEWLDQGGTWIIPLPALQLVTSSHGGIHEAAVTSAVGD